MWGRERKVQEIKRERKRERERGMEMERERKKKRERERQTEGIADHYWPRPVFLGRGPERDNVL